MTSLYTYSLTYYIVSLNFFFCVFFFFCWIRRGKRNKAKYSFTRLHCMLSPNVLLYIFHSALSKAICALWYVHAYRFSWSDSTLLSVRPGVGVSKRQRFQFEATAVIYTVSKEKKKKKTGEQKNVVSISRTSCIIHESWLKTSSSLQQHRKKKRVGQNGGEK